MLKRILSLIAITASILAVNAEELKRYEINVKDFSELKVIEGLTVDYKCSEDSAGMAVFTTSPDMASLLMFTNNKEQAGDSDFHRRNRLPWPTQNHCLLTLPEQGGKQR